MKRLSIFTRRGRPLQHGTLAWASKLSRNFNQRQITVYCEVQCAPFLRREGARGQKIARQYTDKKRRRILQARVVFLNHENPLQDYVKAVGSGGKKKQNGRACICHLKSRKLRSHINTATLRKTAFGLIKTNLSFVSGKRKSPQVYSAVCHLLNILSNFTKPA